MCGEQVEELRSGRDVRSGLRGCPLLANHTGFLLLLDKLPQI